jgi:DNA-binding transcriptional regulator LsrR (DeoR family)
MAKKRVKKRSVIPPPRGRPERPLTEDDRIRIALKKFEPIKNRLRSNEDVRRWFEDELGRPLSGSTISRAIKDALVGGLVHLAVSDRPQPPPNRRADLEAQLVKRFSLSWAVVVDTDERGSDLPASASGVGGRTVAERVDRLHAVLGVALAAELMSGRFFRDGDVIGFGSGRAVYHTVHEALKKSPLSLQNVTLMSLTGAVYAQDHSGRNYFMDGDLHAARAVQWFSRPTGFLPVSYPIVLPGQPMLPELLTAHSLGPRQWKARHPSHAILGVGVLSDGHRFVAEAHGQGPNQPVRPSLHPIAEQLRELVGMCVEVERRWKGYCPVGDICNRLFWIPPPPDCTVDDADRSSIQQLVESINDRLVTISRDQLKTIRNIVLVAASLKKARAVLQLLKDLNVNDDPLVRVIATDRLTAVELLEMSS